MKSADLVSAVSAAVLMKGADFMSTVSAAVLIKAFERRGAHQPSRRSAAGSAGRRRRPHKASESH